MGRLSLLGPHGYHVEFDVGSDRGAIEHDTYRCQHCGQLVLVKDKLQPQAVCKRCMQKVGECCAHRGACHPITNPNFEEWLEQQEENYSKIVGRKWW